MGHGSEVTGRDHGSEITGQRSRVRAHGSEITGQRLRVRDHGSEIKGQRSRVRDHGSEIMGQNSWNTGLESGVKDLRFGSGRSQITLEHRKLQIGHLIPYPQNPGLTNCLEGTFRQFV